MVMQQATDAKIRDKKLQEALDIMQKNLKNVETVARDTKALALKAVEGNAANTATLCNITPGMREGFSCAKSG